MADPTAKDGFAALPQPPYHAVIFSSRDVTAARMVELAQQQPGFLGAESARDASGFGITVSYWRDEASIAAWKQHTEHLVAQENGKTHWYQHYETRVAQVARAYSKT